MSDFKLSHRSGNQMFCHKPGPNSFWKSNHSKLTRTSQENSSHHDSIPLVPPHITTQYSQSHSLVQQSVLAISQLTRELHFILFKRRELIQFIRGVAEEGFEDLFAVIEVGRRKGEEDETLKDGIISDQRLSSTQ